MDLLEASKIKNFKISRKKVTMVSDCSIFHVRPGQTSLPPADHLLPPQTASCQLRMAVVSMQGKRARRNRLKTPTLALTRQLNRLNGTTLSTWLTLRGGSAGLLAGHHQGVHVHRQHLPLFAGVRAGEVHTSRQRASLHSVRAQVTRSPNLG